MRNQGVCRISLAEYATSLHPTVVLRLVSDDLTTSWHVGREPGDKRRDDQKKVAGIVSS
jgi:hypothetical protein